MQTFRGHGILIVLITKPPTSKGSLLNSRETLCFTFIGVTFIGVTVIPITRKLISLHVPGSKSIFYFEGAS
jgi:hypothetical protein